MWYTRTSRVQPQGFCRSCDHVRPEPEVRMQSELALRMMELNDGR